MVDPLRLVQRSFFMPGLTVEVSAQDQLVLQSKGVLRSWSRTFTLDEINPAPIHERVFAAGWALGAAVAVVLFGIAVWGAIHEGPRDVGAHDVGAVFFMGFIGLIVLALVLNAVRLSPNVYAYRSTRAHVVLFTIRRSQPNKAAVDAFVTALAKRIEGYRIPQNATPAQLSEHFQKALDYLLENKVLSAEEHRAATTRLAEKRPAGVVLELIKK